MFVSAERLLGIPIHAARWRLANLIRDGSINETAHSAYRGGMDHLLPAGALGELPGGSRLVRVQVLDPVYRDEAMTIGMRWEAIGAIGGLFPVLDGDISLNPDQGQFTRLKLTGCYRPPLGVLGAGLDRMLMHTVAELTLRSVVTSLAVSLEGTSPVAGPNAGCVEAEDWTADRARLSARRGLPSPEPR